MTLDALAVALDALGVKLTLRVVVEAPAGVLTPEIREALKTHKPGLVARLAMAEVPAIPEGNAPPESEECDTHPPCGPPYPWRAGLLEWPIPWRETWGRRSNELELEEGVCWWKAEQRAFAEVSHLKERGLVATDPTPGTMIDRPGSESWIKS
jgi:TubC N-terminal docking domain